MKFLLLLFVYSILFQISHEAFSGARKTEFINKLYNMLSSWVSKSQYTTILNNYETDFYNEATPSQLGSKLITYGGEALGLQVISAASVLAIPGIMNDLDVLMDVLYNNLTPFYSGQLIPIIQANKAKGLTQNGVINNNYLYLNQFYTLTRSKTLFARVREQFNDTYWATLRSGLANYVQFTVNGL